MSVLHRAASALALILALALTASEAHGLPDDAEQPIEIESDRAELDEASGVAVYAGNVRMRQGTMVVTADTLTIQTAEDAVTRITADGDEEPATFVQQIEPGPASDPDLQVRGRAAQIVYLTTDERIEFEGEAELAQATDRFEGDRISYDLRARRVNASAGDGERMTFTLDPTRMRRREQEDTDGN